jgi:hypothetical protein
MFNFTVYDEQPAVTAIYFWSYMVVAYFIIFNMILAVIFNVYNKKTEALVAVDTPVHDGEEREVPSTESRKEK